MNGEPYNSGPEDAEQSDDFRGDEFYDGENDMSWETAAKEAIQNAVAEITFDEVRGSIYLMSGEDHRFNAVEEEFRGWEELQRRLYQNRLQLADFNELKNWLNAYRGAR